MSGALAIGLVLGVALPASAQRIQREARQDGSPAPVRRIVAGGTTEAALKEFKTSFKSVVLTDPRLDLSGTLVLTGDATFSGPAAEARKGAVAEAFDAWLDALEAQPGAAAEPWLSVRAPAGGSLWRWDGGPVLLHAWPSEPRPTQAEADRPGRLFAFLGGQAVRGDTDSTGLQVRLGSTLFKDRFDFALSYGYSAIDTTPSLESHTYGVVGRALFRVNERFGWNVGAQGFRTDPSRGDTSDSYSGLLGLSLYLPGGSLDLTGTVGNDDAYGVLLGYTVFLTRR